MFSQINMWLGAGAGAVLALGLSWGYNIFIDNPSIVRETTQRVEAESRLKTLTAINEVSDEAQRARAKRRFCIDSGGVFSFSTGECR